MSVDFFVVILSLYTYFNTGNSYLIASGEKSLNSANYGQTETN